MPIFPTHTHNTHPTSYILQFKIKRNSLLQNSMNWWSEKWIANRSQSFTSGTFLNQLIFRIRYRNIMCLTHLRSHMNCDLLFPDFPFANITNSNEFDLFERHSTLNRLENVCEMWMENGECWMLTSGKNSLHLNESISAFVSITSQ